MAEPLKADAKVLRAREKWQWRGQARPAFAHPTGHGEESVWDYPRPPLMVPDARHVQVRAEESVLAETEEAVRLLETASPPTVYVPPGAVRTELLVPAGARSLCEWKGVAESYDVVVGSLTVPAAAWCYVETFPEFEALAGWFSFHPDRLDCRIDGEIAYPQPGGYYGGWVTREIVGPFKGEAGTETW